MFSYLWKASWQTIFWALLFGIFSGLCSAALVATINKALSNQIDLERLLWQFLALCTGALITEMLSYYLTNRLSEATIYKLRIRLSKLILSSPYPNLQKIGKTKQLTNLTADISTIAQAFMLLPDICIKAVIISGCMAYLAWLSWQMALVLSCMILFGITSYLFVAKLPKKTLAMARDEYDNLNQAFRNLIEGIKELKLHKNRRKAFIQQSLAISAENNRRLSLAAGTAFLFANQYAFLLYYSTIALILFALPLYQVNQEVISGYVLVLLYMIGHLGGLTHNLPAFMGARIALEKVQKLGEVLQTDSIKSNEIQQSSIWETVHSLTLQNVTHSFHREKENSNFTLGPISLEFKPGELVFLIGGNGSGKTTLAMLLIGLFQPEQGDIRLNGIPITDANRDDYLQNFSVVFSDFYLFDELFGFDIDRITSKVTNYLERLHLHHKLSLKNGKLTTIELSQGQRKRLALLVAYLEDRPFYVFDEWAADQDPEFKELFYTELLPELVAKGKTVLAITHDDRYFHLADRCIKLEEGQIKAIEFPKENGQKKSSAEITKIY
jgi:putative ATP-binding cassette transporter